MKQDSLTIQYESLSPEEFSAEDAGLVKLAQEASAKAYAPYSEFKVGCALKLEDGTVVTGNNQENASYPCGQCAERTTLFWANANYPDKAPATIAIAAQKAGKFTLSPLPPCGACRQALLETELRFGKPIRMILFGAKSAFILKSISDLLPFQFGKETLDCQKENFHPKTDTIL